MIFTALPLAGAYLAAPQIRQDERGFFFRYFCKDEFRQVGHVKEWIQMNHSFTAKKGALRGMHYQLPPHTEIKFLRCIAGEVFDVIIDLREGSSTFLQWYGTTLSAANRKMLYIPEGFAHGFQALTDNCELIYHHSEYYTAGSEGGIKFDDPTVGIQWPLAVTQVSERDQQHPLINHTFSGIKL